MLKDAFLKLNIALKNGKRTVCANRLPSLILLVRAGLLKWRTWSDSVLREELYIVWSMGSFYLFFFSRGESMESFEAVWRPIKLNLSLFSTEESSPLNLLLRRTSKSSPPSSCSSNEANHTGFLGVLQQSLPLDSVIQLNSSSSSGILDSISRFSNCLCKQYLYSLVIVFFFFAGLDNCREPFL